MYFNIFSFLKQNCYFFYYISIYTSLIHSAAGGELFQHMILEDCFQERDVIRLMRQIIDGVKFLHNASIVHLDIKVSFRY